MTTCLCGIVLPGFPAIPEPIPALTGRKGSGTHRREPRSLPWPHKPQTRVPALLPGSSQALAGQDGLSFLMTMFPHLRRKCWPWAAATSLDPSSKSTWSAVLSLSLSPSMGQEGNHKLVPPPPLFPTWPYLTTNPYSCCKLPAWRRCYGSGEAPYISASRCCC